MPSIQGDSGHKELQRDRDPGLIHDRRVRLVNYESPALATRGNETEIGLSWTEERATPASATREGLHP